MGWLDDEIKGVLGALNPLQFAQPLAWDEVFGPSGGGGPNASLGSLDPGQYQQYIDRINEGSGRGTYGEGLISTARDVFRDLENQFRSGNMSASDYMAISGAILPTLTDNIHNLMGKGKAAANAANAAGAQELFKFGKDFDILNYGKQVLGRDLTGTELDQFRPVFEGSDTEGRAALARYAEDWKFSPEGLSQRSGEYSDDVGRLFQDFFQRDATQDELDYYGRQRAAGVTPYELQAYLRETPEFRKAEDERFRGDLAGELEGYDRDFFNKAQEDVISRARRGPGGAGTSTALDFALTNLMGDIAKERGRYLAGLSADQYGGNKAAAREDYLGQRNRAYQQSDYRQGRSDYLQDRSYGRANELSDYRRQRDDYMRYLEQNRGGGGGFPWGEVAGAAVGGAAGAFTGNPQWASFGMNAGRSLGRGYDYLNYY